MHMLNSSHKVENLIKQMHVKDLGVLLDSKLRFNKHLNKFF